MNESESKFGSMPDSGTEELRNEVQSLRQMFSLSLLLMFIFCFCMFIFLFRQTTALRAQVRLTREQIGRFEAGGGPAQAAELMLRLGEYAKTHPDYMPIYQKYSEVIKIRPVNNQAAKK